MKLKIRPSQSDWADLGELLSGTQETVKENKIVMLCLFVISFALMTVVFIVGISI